MAEMAFDEGGRGGWDGMAGVEGRYRVGHSDEHDYDRDRLA
jgi:hypothetical protein